MAKPVLVVDNYDSFVFNLVQYIEQLGVRVVVERNNEIDLQSIRNETYGGVLISPGPGHPSEAGSSVEIIQLCEQLQIPMLGVCLGHQALGLAFGATITSAPELFHGRSSLTTHAGEEIFRGIPSPVATGRYHSLVVSQENLPSHLQITAMSGDVIMGLRHTGAPLEGVQFHPESVLSGFGHVLIANWLERCGFQGLSAQALELSAAMNDIRSALPLN